MIGWQETEQTTVVLSKAIEAAEAEVGTVLQETDAALRETALLLLLGSILIFGSISLSAAVAALPGTS